MLYGQSDRQVIRYNGLVLGSLQARGHWFEPSCAHQVRSRFRNVALIAKSKRRAKGLSPETSRRPWTRWPGGFPRAAFRSPVTALSEPSRRSPGSGRPECGCPGQGPCRKIRSATRRAYVIVVRGRSMPECHEIPDGGGLSAVGRPGVRRCGGRPRRCPSRASALCRAASLRVRKAAATTESVYRKLASCPAGAAAAPDKGGIHPDKVRGYLLDPRLELGVIPVRGRQRPVLILGVRRAATATSRGAFGTPCGGDSRRCSG